ncbi:hypothetical protein D3C84_1189910 [compost metagenome]
MLLLLLRNPHPRIADLPLHVDAAVDAFQHPYPYHYAAIVGELDRVAQQIVEDLANP